NRESSIADETDIASDPLPGTAGPEADRPIALADTAESGPNAHRPDDSLSSGKTLHSDTATPFGDQVPQKIGRFLVLRKLGAGGMGIVVEAYDPELNRKVAIKLLRTQRARTSQARLLREAQAMARVSHPNVVHVYDVGLVDNQVFIAMELVDGHTLADWLADNARPWREVVSQFIEAGRGLAAAHAAGLVHRDFKPDNVLLAHDGRVRVADFGLAREGREQTGLPEWTLEDNPGERPLLANTLTATGVLMGTPMYMSPEQHLGEEAGTASDIFSFSVALFEGLYGVRPFEAETMLQLTRRVLNSEMVTPPTNIRVPSWLDKVVRRGLAVEPEDRWPDFSSYLGALRADPRGLRRRLFGGAT
ncbi:MAG: protein kinase domain-containing protein, partial [Nannocystaceae bacterium]